MAENTEPLDAEHRAWIEEFEAAARRPLELRMRYAFVKTYKPVLDDADYRSFDSMEEYRQWCEIALPSWLGYGRGEYRQAQEPLIIDAIPLPPATP